MSNWGLLKARLNALNRVGQKYGFDCALAEKIRREVIQLLPRDCHLDFGLHSKKYAIVGRHCETIYTGV